QNRIPLRLVTICQRRLRAAMWRQWKTPRRRRAALLEFEVRPRLASNTAGSGLGPRYLAEANALSWGFLMRTSNRLDFLPFLRECRRNHLEPPYTDPYVRRCGRGRRVTAAPMPIWSPSVYHFPDRSWITRHLELRIP